jgi:hypothetical protein
MYSHELADALRKLAAILKAGPDVELNELQLSGSFSPTAKQRKREDLPIALNALLSLSLVDKKEWALLIEELGLKIQIRPRDASRDLLGKVLKALEADPHARLQLTAKAKTAQSSPQLARALSALLDR